MKNPKRTILIPAGKLTSSYRKRRSPNQRWPIDVFKKGRFITSDMFEALKELDQLVKLHNGNLYIIDLFRSWETQQKARNDYKSGKKSAYIAKPGRSFHNAGRAVDISVDELGFSGIEKKKWLETLWELAMPLGFRPIIKNPVLGISECWHFDFPGEDWKKSYDQLEYSEVAKCAVLDVGEWDPSEKNIKIQRMFIQAQLIRLGYFDIGKVDGILGRKTNRVLNSLGLLRKSLDSVIDNLIKE